MANPVRHSSEHAKDVRVKRWPWSIEHSLQLEHPYVTAGNRVYSIATQHGEYVEIGWRQPNEMSGVWDHPIKLLDGFWFGVTYGHTLIGASSKIQWLTRANRWQIKPGEVEITYTLPTVEVVRQEWGVDDYEGILVRLRLKNTTQQPQALVLHLLARTDLRAAWLGENRLTWRDGQDEAVYLAELSCIAAYNTVNPAFVLFGAASRADTATIGPELWATKQTRGQGISGQLSYALTLPVGATEELAFIIAGSTRSSEAALETYRQLRSSFADLAARQVQRYQQLIDRSALYCDDELMETAFGWAKVNLQMLERNVPGIGQGVAGGFPDYPWWFGKDTTYSTLPLVASGQFELALNSLRNLARHSQANQSDGGVVHEILTQGHVHDNGHLVEVPLFVRACYHAYCWTGDRAFLREQYEFCKHGMLDLVSGSHTLDEDGCPTGKGLVESRELQSGNGFKTLDIAAYTYEALLDLAEMATAMGDLAILPILQARASLLRERVNGRWWLSEEGLFGDIYTSAHAIAASHLALKAEMPLWPGDQLELERSDALLKRFADQHHRHQEMLAQPRPWLLKHMIAATPMETGLATPEHALQAFSRLESDEFCGPWGIYLNPERQRLTMSLPNGIMAAAEARYQRIDQSLAFSHKIASTVTLRMPGGFSDNPPAGGSFVQAWSTYGIIWPVMHYYFGFRPHAAERRLCFAPHLPSSWQQARLENVRVGNQEVMLEIVRTERSVCIVLETDDPSFEVTLGYITSQASNVQSVVFNGERVSVSHSCPAEFGTLNEQSMWIPTVSGLPRYELQLHWE